MKADDIDAMLVRHRPYHDEDGTRCFACGQECPCDAVTALIALRDALAVLDGAGVEVRRERDRADAAEAQVRAVLALCDEAESPGTFGLVHPSRIRAAIEGATP